jgi:selenocysteine lyase/cysteine desulfurase
VREAGEAALARRGRPWTIRAPDFFTDAERLRGLFARLVGGDGDGVAIVPSVSYGAALAARNLPVGAGDRVVVLDDEFPSNVYPWHTAAAEAGATLVTVRRPPDGDWTPAVLAALEPGAAVVAAPNCHWTDGALVDLERVGELAREVGAALVVDATQSLGARPLDLGRVRPDFLLAAAYKWLLGPYGLAFAWVAPHRREGRPLEEAWIARAGSEDFDRLVDYRDDYQPGARRYDMGERSSFILLPMAIAAVERILAWGVERIAATAAPLTARVEHRVAELGLRALPAERRVAHLVGVALPGSAPRDLTARLAGRGVHVSVRGRSLRVSPHVYNRPADVDRLAEALAAELGR